jgi:hypothetical protein
MRDEMSFKSKRKRVRDHGKDFESFFKIGVSAEYILIRDDFPIAQIPPGDFSKLCKEMFRRNEEALHNGK